MDEYSPDIKKARVKELEQIVRKLEQENKHLLSKVRTSSPTLHETASDFPSDGLDDGLIDLDSLNLDVYPEGEWLYVSPKLSLTPAQKKQTPLQWLSEGHNSRLNIDVPSLDEVKKALVFNMEEAETLSKAAHPRSNPSNRTAQKYLNRVRERSRSNSPTLPALENGDDSIPVISWESSEFSGEPETENNETVPVVKWKPQMPEEDVPTVQWKKPKMPQEDSENLPVIRKAKMPQEDTNEDVPVVKWKPKMPQEDTNKDVPVIKWKPKMPQEDTNEDVPVVKWKPKMPQEDVGKAKMPQEDTNEDVPVIKWKPKMPQEDIPVRKAKMPREDSENVPAVRKAKMPQEDTTENVPVVKWKPKMPQEDVPAVRKARVPQEETEDVPVITRSPKMPRKEARVVRRAKMPVNDSEDQVPVAKWKQPKMPQEDNEGVRNVRTPEEGVPVVKWKAKVPGDNVVKGASPTGSPGQSRHTALARPVVIKRNEMSNGRTNETGGESPEMTHGGDLNIRTLKVPAYRRSHSAVHPSNSPTSSLSEIGAGKGLRKPRASSPKQSLSPFRSRSPSPVSTPPPAGPKRQLSRATASSSPSGRTTSPGRSNLVQPGGSPKILRMKSLTNHPSGLPATPKSQESVQRVSRLQAHRDTQQQSTPPQTGSRRTPGSSGIRAPSPSGSGSGKQRATPPKGGTASKARRMLPTPPSTTSPPRQQQSPAATEDDWLEGCF